MDIQCENVPRPEELEQFIKINMPDAQARIPWLNKRVVVVGRGPVAANIIPKNGMIQVKGNINTSNPLIIISIVIGVLFGFIGALVIIGVLYLIFNSKRKEFEQEVGNLVSEHFY